MFVADAGWFANANLSLWRIPDLTETNWTRVNGAVVQNLGASVRLIDPLPPANKSFYRVGQQP